MQVVVCGECGERSPADVQFCGQCGAFLEWDAQSSAPDDAGAPTVPDGDADGVVAAARPGPAATEHPAGPPSAPGRSAPGSSVPGSSEPGAGRPRSASPGAGPPRSASSGAAPSGSPPLARSSTGPGSPRPPASDAPRQPATPGVVRPGEVHARRQVSLPREEPGRLAPGERACPRCGSGNAPTRQFCRSCGSLLAEASAVTGSTGWWRRLLTRLRGRRHYDAGTRRKVRSTGGGRRWTGVIVVVVLVALAVVLVPTGLLGQATEAVRDRVGKRVPVPPVAFRASSVGRGAAAEQVADGASNRYWAPAGSPVGAWVEVDLPDPVRLVEVIITAGASMEQKQFRAQGRPHELLATVATRA
ncbi:MAG TPA: hypothetical protein VF755_16095, partial [Catenuloplanes sp.]